MSRIAGLTDKQARVKIEQDQQAREKIMDTYGLKAVKEAEARLCDTCSVACPGLLPLTMKGEDCPYYIKGEKGDS